METIMADSAQYEIILFYPADSAQQMPPDAAFSRNSILRAADKPEIDASSPASLGGDASRYNPEELMLMSLAQCHMLTYLAIAAKKRIGVLAYTDRASGVLGTGANGKISFQSATLHPRVTVARGTNLADAQAIHEKAHANCFMANSVNFPVGHVPEIMEA
jgi:organic hydroperoxide reductase OsmC/OhrA